MSYYDLPSLKTLILKEQCSAQQAGVWLENILSFLFNSLYIYDRQGVTENYIKNIHLKRCFRRLMETVAKVDKFRSLVYSEYIWVNEKKLINILPLIEMMFQSEVMQAMLCPSHLCRTQGDLHFDNVLVDKDTDNFILLDPRGTVEFDVFYDIGKLYHSCHSYYDLIWHGNYSWNFKQDKINYSWNGNLRDAYDQIYKKLNETLSRFKTIQEEPRWQLKAQFAEAMHMCSVIPFQFKMDGEERIALMCYARGVEVLNEVFENLKKECVDQGIRRGDIININTESDYIKAKRIFEK